MTLRGGRSDFSGPDRLVLEMQGGGETTNTGLLTRHVRSWRNDRNYSNALLRTETGASTLETKTWKGYGIAFCVGTLLYDYLMKRISAANLPDLRDYNWTMALIAFKEDMSKPRRKGAIPLTIDDSRLLYTNYQTFVQALINQGEPSLQAFRGNFINLRNEEVDIP